MKLDFTIEHPLASGLFIAVAAVYTVRTWLRFGRVYYRDNLRDEDQWLWVAALSPFDERIWTDEGIALHREYFSYSARSATIGVLLWVVLDALS